MNWRVLHASVAGSSHEFAGLACQDANAFKVLANGVLIAAVADGAGSARFAERASALAVVTAVDSLTRRLSDVPSFEPQLLSDLLQNVADDVHAALKSAAETLQLPETPSVAASIGDFATTLLMCIVTDSHVGAFQIGDGAIVELSRDGAVVALTGREVGEYFNETTFVTSENYRAHVSQMVKASSTTDSIALLTDGLQLLAITTATNEPFAPFFLSLFRYAKTPGANSEELVRFLRSARVCERTDDDKTLLIAVPSSSA